MESYSMKVDNIAQGTFEGYYWKSGETVPYTLLGEEFSCSLDDKSNPFIIEAQLYDKENLVSYSLKYVDGEYLIYKWEGVSPDMKSENYTCLNYHANRVGEDRNYKIQSMKFLLHWVDEVDPKCEGMNVLQPKELIFVGFNA